MVSFNQLAMDRFLFVQCLTFLCAYRVSASGPLPIFQTVVTSKDVDTGEIVSRKQPYEGPPLQAPTYQGAYIDVQVVDKPHNLFIGRCMHNEEELHREIIVLNNDGKSHVSAHIHLNVDEPGDVEIGCVNVYDEAPGVGAYPSYVGGGVGYNFVEIAVATQFGKGFKFFVQIFGKVIR